MSEHNKRVARLYMEAMGVNDSETMASCLADGAWADAKGHGNLSGKRMADVMVGMLEEFRRVIPSGLRFDIIHILGEGDWVALEAEGNGVLADGKDYRNRYAFLFRFEEGKIKEINEYFCTIYADKMLWPLVHASGVNSAAS